MSTHARPYDAGPALRQARLALLEHDRPADPRNLAAVLGCDPRSVRRYLAGDRLRDCDADRLACRLGLHPLNLWPDYHERRNA